MESMEELLVPLKSWPLQMSASSGMVVLSTRTADATGVGMSEMDVTMIVVKNKDERMLVVGARRYWMASRKKHEGTAYLVKRSRSRGSEG